MARSRSSKSAKRGFSQALIEQHRLDWQTFTRGVQIVATSITALLLLMLLFLRLL